MSFRVQVVEELMNDLKDTNAFKKLYKNIVPVWTNIPEFPAIALLYEQEEKAQDSLTTRKNKYVGTLVIYIFNVQQSENEYEDVLSDLIDLVYDVVEKNNFIQCNTIDASFASMKRDGGTIHPYAIAQIKLRLEFLE